MIKKIILALTITIGLLFTNQAVAIGALDNAKVTQVRIDSNGWGMIFFDKPLSGSPPSCVIPAYSSALAFDATTASGKAIMAMALTAKTTGATVLVYGLATCNIYRGYVEDFNHGFIQ